MQTPYYKVTSFDATGKGKSVGTLSSKSAAIKQAKSYSNSQVDRIGPKTKRTVYTQSTEVPTATGGRTEVDSLI